MRVLFASLFSLPTYMANSSSLNAFDKPYAQKFSCGLTLCTSIFSRMVFKRRTLPIIFGIFVLLAGCDGRNRSIIVPETFGLERTTSEGELLRGGITIANILLKNRSDLSFSREETDGIAEQQIPIFVLSSINLNLSDVMWVPKGCRCVYVHARGLRRWLDKAQISDGYGDHFDERDAVAFFLLHEMGHVIHEKPGALLEFEDANPSENMDKNNSKAEEDNADAFAEGVIKKALTSEANDRATANAVSQNVAVLATNIYTAIILSTTLDNIMCLSPRVYWDWGYTHPNLAYRLVRLANNLAPTETISTALNDFEKCRALSPEYFDALN
ncbi:hypothetical protein [Rhizobium leguminosarum]